MLISYYIYITNNKQIKNILENPIFDDNYFNTLRSGYTPIVDLSFDDIYELIDTLNTLRNTQNRLLDELDNLNKMHNDYVIKVEENNNEISRLTTEIEEFKQQLNSTNHY